MINAMIALDYLFSWVQANHRRSENPAAGLAVITIRAGGHLVKIRADGHKRQSQM